MNLIVITSIISIPNLPLSYTPVRSVFTEEQRYQQTILTIESIRKNIPNSHIVILECSPNSNFLEEIKTKVEYFFNYFEDKDVKDVVYSIHKGCGECKLLSQIFNTKILWEYNNLYKLSGRYKLTENFSSKIFDNDLSLFKLRENSVSTIFYKINKKDYQNFKNILEISFTIIEKTGKSIENVFYYLLNGISDFIQNYYLGISGYCSVDGSLIEY